MSDVSILFGISILIVAGIGFMNGKLQKITTALEERISNGKSGE